MDHAEDRRGEGAKLRSKVDYCRGSGNDFSNAANCGVGPKSATRPPHNAGAILLAGVGRLTVDQDDVLQRLTRVETKLDILIEDKHDTAAALKTANEALEKVNSAHKRLDRIDKIIFWAGTTIIGALIVGAIKIL